MHTCIYVYVVLQNTNKKKKGHQLKRPSNAPSTAPLRAPRKALSPLFLDILIPCHTGIATPRSIESLN